MTEQNLRAKRDDVSQKAFSMMFRVLAYLLLPALAGVGVGKWLDMRFATEKMWSLILLGIAFILSWTLIILDYRKLHHEITALEKEEQRHPGINK